MGKIIYSVLKNRRIKKLVKYASIISLVMATGCSKYEVSSNELFTNEISNLSANSVKLPIVSESVIASSSHSSYPAINALDGNLSTRWTGNGVGTTLEIDLKREDLVDYVKISHYAGDKRVYKFVIYTKLTADSDWTQVGSKSSSGDSIDLEIYDVANSTARYIMIESNGNTSNNWSDIIEIEVYGTIGEVVSDECVAEVPTNRETQLTSNSSVTLSWDAIPNIDHFNLRYKKVDENYWYYSYNIKTNSLLIEGLTKGEDYLWQIRAKCADGSATSYNEAESYFTTKDDDDAVPEVTPGTFNLEDFQIETSWLTGEDSRTTQSFVATEIDNEPWYTKNGDNYELTSLMTDGNRTEWKEYSGKEASLSVYKNMEYLAKFENIPENGVTIAQVHNRGGVNRPLLRVYIHDDNQIHVKVTLTTPDEASSTYYTSTGIEYNEGDDVKTQIRIEDGEIEINVATGGNVLNEVIVPSDDWNAYSDSYYLKAGVYTEGDDTFVKGIFNYFVVEK